MASGRIGTQLNRKIGMREKMGAFASAIVINPRLEEYVDDFGVPNHWKLSTRPDPSRRYWYSDSGIIHEYVRAEELQAVTNDALEKYRQGLEIIIHASDYDEAADVQSIVHAGTLLPYPDFMKVSKPATPFPEEELDRQTVGLGIAKSYVRFSDNILYGLAVAETATNDDELGYALEKWKFSLSLDSFTLKSIHPRYGQVFSSHYERRSHRVNAAMAIVAAYSVVEELGLAVRASTKKKRFVENKWNPEVLEDLNQRLRKSHVDPAETVEWIHRGQLKPLDEELEHPALRVEPSEWGGYRDVQDVTMPMPEAIQRTAYLRNSVAAHKLARTKHLARWLGPYEVYNVQNVARRLLLGRTGLRGKTDSAGLILSQDSLIRKRFA